jgi:hypothetical protein
MKLKHPIFSLFIVITIQKTANMKKALIIIISFAIITIISCDNKQEGENNAAKADSVTFSDIAPEADPLPGWTNGTLKKDIIAFVTKIQVKGSPDFVPLESRIATFDNDGTLWAEKPYVQELFAFYRVKKMIAAKPALANKQPFKAVVEGDKDYFIKGGAKALIELVGATHTGMTENEFEAMANEFFAMARYPGRNVPIRNITYQPQIELLNYLRANGFRIFIVTGGTIELVRSISSAFYGIPKEQVVGTTFNYRFIDSTRSVYREPSLALMDDKEGKPVGIQIHIGQRPLFACGNEGGSGDIAMLKYCQGNKYPSFQMLVNHNDSLREYYYQEKDNASLDAAKQNNWHVISMKDDWNTIFVK